MRVHPALPLIAGAVIAPRRIVKFSAAKTVIQAAAATDSLIGVSDSLGAAAGERVEVYTSGPGVEIEVGGNIARGAEITSDAVGRAVTAAPAAGATCRIIGIAMDTYVLGDVGDFILTQASKTTPAA